MRLWNSYLIIRSSHCTSLLARYPGWNLRLPGQTSNNFRWLDSLWNRDVIWRYISGSTRFQVMACCLTAPSLYLHQSWLINEARWHSAEGNCTENFADIDHHKMFDNAICENMMSSSNGNIFRVTGHLCGEFTGLDTTTVPSWHVQTYSDLTTITVKNNKLCI